MRNAVPIAIGVLLAGVSMSLKADQGSTRWGEAPPAAESGAHALAAGGDGSPGPRTQEVKLRQPH